MKNLIARAASSLLFLAAAPLVANEKLEEIVVVSSRVETPLRQVGTSVSVITAQDIEIRGFDSLANAMRYEPGVSVTNNGGPGKSTNLAIRGERGFRTRTFIDGIEITDPSTPQAGPNFAHVLGDGIGRVEILRGTQGMMYGADAGGVVAITTRSAQEGFSGLLSAEYGRFDTNNVSAILGAKGDSFDGALTAAHFETDGFNAQTTDDTLRDNDGYENTTVHARAGWQIMQDVRFEGVARRVDADNEFDDCFTNTTFEPTNDCTNEYEQNAWRVAIAQDGDAFSNSLAYNLSATEREFLSAGKSTFATQGEVSEVAYLGSWRSSDALQLVYGAELRNEAIDDGSSDTDRDQQGYYVEYQAALPQDIYVTAGARYDDNDDFGSETTYRASAAYLRSVGHDTLKLRGAYGTGFRAPSLTEIAFNQSPAAFPPASGISLSAETSTGYDIAVGYFAAAGWLVELVYFDQQVENEIFFDLIDFSGYLQGDGESSSEGVELIAEFPLSENLQLLSNYSYTDATDSDGADRLRVPKHLANVGLLTTILQDRLRINLNLRISQDSQDSTGRIDDYEVVDLNAAFRVSEQLEFFGRIENLTDKDYEEIPTFNTSGAAAYAGIRFSL